MRDPEFALEERSIQILTDPYKSILVSGILPLVSEFAIFAKRWRHHGGCARSAYGKWCKLRIIINS